VSAPIRNRLAFLAGDQPEDPNWKFSDPLPDDRRVCIGTPDATLHEGMELIADEWTPEQMLAAYPTLAPLLLVVTWEKDEETHTTPMYAVPQGATLISEPAPPVVWWA
jgi:hypothetical protein